MQEVKNRKKRKKREAITFSLTERLKATEDLNFMKRRTIVESKIYSGFFVEINGFADRMNRDIYLCIDKLTTVR